LLFFKNICIYIIVIVIIFFFLSSFINLSIAINDSFTSQTLNRIIVYYFVFRCITGLYSPRAGASLGAPEYVSSPGSDRYGSLQSYSDHRSYSQQLLTGQSAGFQGPLGAAHHGFDYGSSLRQRAPQLQSEIQAFSRATFHTITAVYIYVSLLLLGKMQQ
jgi:hypothetical protein